MFALPHHVQSFEATTAAKIQSAVNLYSPTKGVMSAVIADQWRLTEANLPTNIGWLPVKSSGSAVFSAAALNKLSAVAKYELQQDFTAVTNLDTMYFSGKALAKYAFMCLTMSEVLKDVNLTKQCQVKLKVRLSQTFQIP
jgi:endo-1,3(4)-beta-glucanase